ncbi:MAG: YceI family protein [Clostridia bacterium]|nr:YceI family protein [Clostridia bacterium]
MKIFRIITRSLLLVMLMHLSVNMVAQTGNYVADAKKSNIKWICGNHNGTIKIKKGDLTLADGKITKGSFEINMDSITDIDIDYELMRLTLENIIRSIDYFDAEHYPVSRFTITKVNPGGNKQIITGDLQAKDQKHPVTFPATVSIQGNTLRATSDKFKIDRTRWGLTTASVKYVKSKDAFTFSDDIYLVIELHAVKK